MRISDWSSDVCSSDLKILGLSIEADANFWESPTEAYEAAADLLIAAGKNAEGVRAALARYRASAGTPLTSAGAVPLPCQPAPPSLARSEEHTSELQSLMRISYAVFCLKKKTKKNSTEQTGPNYISRQSNTTSGTRKRNRKLHDS